MRARTRGRFALLFVLAVLAMSAAVAHAQEVPLTPTVALGPLDQAATDAAFETRTLSRLGETKRTADAGGSSGDTPYLLRKDRGPHPGQYAVLVTMPTAGARTGAAFVKALPGLRQYSLVGPASAGPLPTVDVVAVHYIKVKPGGTAAFDKFIADKLNPAVANLRPDLRFLYYRGDDGTYITIVGLTRASRDKYWPKGADSDDLKAAFTPSVRALAGELETYLVADTWGTGMTAQGYEAKDWADWTIVGAGH
jgi:hypothetical protein